MSGKRTSVTKNRPRPRCQVEVFDADIEDYKACGRPAVSRWTWGDGCLNVCLEHDKEIRVAEANSIAPIDE